MQNKNGQGISLLFFLSALHEPSLVRQNIQTKKYDVSVSHKDEDLWSLILARRSCSTRLLFLCKSLFLLIMFSIAISLVSNEVFAESSEKEKEQLLVAGWLESVILEPWNIKLRAKLDTGAKTSSLHAVDIERFERDDKEWIRFRTTDPIEKNALRSLEVPLVRDVKIKRHKFKAQTRPVVEMTFCLDGQIYNSEFSLTDRSRFNYQVLLGRRILQQGILVDPAATFTLKTNRITCKKLMAEKDKKDKENKEDKKNN